MIMSTVEMLKSLESPTSIKKRWVMQEEVVQSLLQYLQNTQDFILDQVPQVVQEALRYEKISASITALFMVCLLAAAAFVFHHFWKYPALDSYGSRTVSSVMGMYIPGAISTIFFILLAASVDRLIKIHIAPKYFLIQLFLDMN